jgi:glucokinase
MLIAGDIGGTKTDLAIFSSEVDAHAPLAEEWVHSANYPNLTVLSTRGRRHLLPDRYKRRRCRNRKRGMK